MRTLNVDSGVPRVRLLPLTLYLLPLVLCLLPFLCCCTTHKKVTTAVSEDVSLSKTTATISADSSVLATVASLSCDFDSLDVCYITVDTLARKSVVRLKARRASFSGSKSSQAVRTTATASSDTTASHRTMSQSETVKESKPPNISIVILVILVSVLIFSLIRKNW